MPENNTSNPITPSESQVRIFRQNPIAWFDKSVMRFLRAKYGKDKKRFIMLRSVYTALCEIESDFRDKPINFFTKTVGTYAGVSREVAGKYINFLEKEGLIKKTRMKDTTTKKFLSGTIIEILGIPDTNQKEYPHQEQPEKPVSGYPSTGIPQHRDTPAGIKKINTYKKLTNVTNVNENETKEAKKRGNGMASLAEISTQYDIEKLRYAKKPAKPQTADERAKRDYYAQTMIQELNDQKSLGAFRVIAEHVPEDVIFQALASVKETARDGKIKQSRGALFMSIIQTWCAAHGKDLGFKPRASVS
jgi:hypothetical protein